MNKFSKLNSIKGIADFIITMGIYSFIMIFIFPINIIMGTLGLIIAVILCTVYQVLNEIFYRDYYKNHKDELN